MQTGEITYQLDELHLYIEGRESTLYVYGKADVSFEYGNEQSLMVERITLTMEKGELELGKRDPLFSLIERTLIEHTADDVWEAINEEYEEDAYWSRVDEGRQQAKDRMVGGL